MEILPKINEYNREIAKFLAEINAKCGIMLNYTQLEISEIRHWTETFQVVANTGNQPEQQQPQVPQISVAVPSPQAPTPLLREQQEGINRLTYMTQEPPMVQEGATYYNPIDRNRSSCHCSAPHMSPVPLTTDSIGTMTVSDTIGIVTMIGGPNTTTG